MTLPFLESRSLRWILPALVFMAASPTALLGQLDALKEATGNGEKPAPAAPEKPEALRARIEQWQVSARDTLAVLEAPNAAASLPAGITLAELDDRRRSLEGMLLITTQWLKSVDAAGNSRKGPEADRVDVKTWAGFKETPPYSILLVDELLNERDAIRANLTSTRASLANYERLLQTLVADTKEAEDAVSARIVEVQNADGSAAGAAKWRLEAAREKSRLMAARSSTFQNNCQNLRDRLASAGADLDLVEKKIRVATSNSRFSDEDFARIQKIAEDRKLAVSKELEGIAKRLKAAKTARTQAQAALDALIASAPQGKEPEGLDLAKFRVEVTQGRLETLHYMTEWLEGLPQLENIVLDAYQSRRTILIATDPKERKAALALLNDILERIEAWGNVVGTEVANSQADLSQLESRVASITAEDPRFSLISEQRATKTEKLTLIERVSQAVTGSRKLVERWIEEYAPKSTAMGTLPRLRSLAANTWSALQGLWNFELMSFKDSIVVEGQTITGNIPITVGMLLRALLFFVIGYWIASRFARRIQASLVTRGHIAEAQAKTLRNWAMIVVSVFLVIGTLSFLKIPLTVFAFFGGALAIGLGFGMQTLIKNFISGIIVLAERKVRVGDVVDVEGVVGSVTEINTRSSIIRGADDVETMIPNSLFLENRVTNWTLSSARMRRSLKLGVAYGTSPQQVMEVLTESAGRHGLIRKSPEPFAVFDDFGDSALIFTLYFWVEIGGGTNPLVVASDLRIMIDKRFAELGIGFPFPQRDMHLSTTHPLQVECVGRPEEPPSP